MLPAGYGLFSKMPLDSVPRQRLEDFTRGDIASYVNDTVGSHPVLQYCAPEILTTWGLIKRIVNKSYGDFLGLPGNGFAQKRPTNADSM
jgi:hypothetical protein